LAKKSHPIGVVVADAITHSADAATAKALFAQAAAAGEDDGAVYLATARRLVRDADCRGAFAYIDLMLQRGVPISREVLSFMLETAGNFSREGVECAADAIISSARWCLEHKPGLLSHKVTTDVIAAVIRWETSSACMFASELLDTLPGSAKYFSREFVNNVLIFVHWRWVEKLASSLLSKEGYESPSPEVTRDAVVAGGQFLISLCKALQRDGTGRHGIHGHMHPYQFDDVMRMLDDIGEHELIAQIYYVMRLGYPPQGIHSEYLDGGDDADTSYSSYALEKLVPTGYAIGAAIDTAVKLGDVDMLVDALQWSLERRPPALRQNAMTLAFTYLYR
jgi:hypothetical protein